jgi:AraC family transcriptional activator of pobA
MKKDNTLIPTVTLEKVRAAGVQVVNYCKLEKDHFVRLPHRDIDYLFVLVKRGYLKLKVDFAEVLIPEESIYFILPGQIHQYLDSDLDIWVLATDAYLIGDLYKLVLDETCYTQLPLQVTTQKADKLVYCLTLLAEVVAEEVKASATAIYKEHIKRGVIDVIIGLIAEEYAVQMSRTDKQESRSVVITTEFKKALFHNYKRLKKPSDYARALNVSTPYLNEAVKLVSGHTASYWIQFMIMIEAKRLLYHTDYTIKHIAYEIGFQDQAYFTRLFTKVEKMSPLAFRSHYR